MIPFQDQFAAVGKDEYGYNIKTLFSRYVFKPASSCFVSVNGKVFSRFEILRHAVNEGCFGIADP